MVIECGGKDALILAADTDVDAAAWGGLSNAGQTCAGVERVYAVAAVYDRFVAGADYGPITMPSQVETGRTLAPVARGAD